mmetsp:Transcript_3616/g.11192  ORF Transcript_3616/g.11192 Transcript_3616/m.11192 type:complete len:231 (+) Transcript_3616:192-884(+)
MLSRWSAHSASRRMSAILVNDCAAGRAGRFFPTPARIASAAARTVGASANASTSSSFVRASASNNGAAGPKNWPRRVSSIAATSSPGVASRSTDRAVAATASAVHAANVDAADASSASSRMRRVAYKARRWPSWTSSNFRTLVRCSALTSSTFFWILVSASVMALASTGRSSPTLRFFMRPAIRSPPNVRNIGSRTDTKNRDAPASPWRPDRPRNWSSMRTDSWRSVPRT